MKIRTLSSFIIISTVLALLTGCGEKMQDPSNLKGGTHDLEFTVLDTIEVSYNSATIRVQHNGTSNDSWYGFVTDQVGSREFTLIAEEIKKITKNGKPSGLSKVTNRRVELTGLKANKRYKYIVFAITADGDLYGTTKSIQFTTDESAFLMTQLEDDEKAWTVIYEGRNSSTNTENYSVVFNKTGAARCHIGFIPKYLVDYYNNDQDIQAEIQEYGGLRLQIGEDVFLFSVMDYLVWEELYEYWGYYDEDDAFFEEDTFKESYTFDLRSRQQSGEYYGVAIGFTDQGTPTFTYTVDEIVIEKETASDAYNNWIGTWNVSSANGLNYTLTFEENDPNFSFFVYGWECGTAHTKECPIECSEHEIYYDFSDFELGIPAFKFNALTGKTFVESTLLEGEKSENGNLYWGMYGYTKQTEGDVAILTAADIIAEATTPVDGESTMTGCESVTYKTDNSGNITEEVTFTYTSLGYLQYNDTNYEVKPWNIPAELPLTFTKVDSVPDATAARAKAARKEAFISPLARKTYNKSILRNKIEDIL